MIQLLVDPWILENLIRDPRALTAFTSCIDIAREFSFDIAQFVDHEAAASIWAQQSEAGPLVGTAAATVNRELEHFLVVARQEPDAVVENEPTGLPKLWHQALRFCIGDGTEWRSPRIVHPSNRRAVWPSGPEVTVKCSDCTIQDPQRVLTAIEEFRAHPFFVADLDPWDLRRQHPLPTSGRNLAEHECWLPRPPVLDGVPFYDLDRRLVELRDSDWKTATHRFYLPPRDWTVGTEPKVSWRSGRGFPRGKIGDHSGWRDRNGYIWEWHPGDREWDVQIGDTHLDVAPDGTLKQ